MTRCGWTINMNTCMSQLYRDSHQNNWLWGSHDRAGVWCHVSNRFLKRNFTLPLFLCSSSHLYGWVLQKYKLVCPVIQLCFVGDPLLCRYTSGPTRPSSSDVFFYLFFVAGPPHGKRSRVSHSFLSVPRERYLKKCSIMLGRQGE